MFRYRKNHRYLFAIPVIFIILALLSVGALYLSSCMKYGSAENRIENEKSENDPRNYYFSQLTAKEQLLYKAIKKSAENCETETEILEYKFTQEEFERATKALILDDPILFYVDFNSIKLFEDKYKSSVEIAYIEDKSEIDRMKMEVEANVAAAMAYLRFAEDDFEKEVYLHDFLSRTCEYKADPEPDDTSGYHTAYGALVLKKAYCDGYSAAFKLLLDRAGIECIVTEGTAKGQLHEWNVVRIDGNYYNVDVTWDDADLEFAPLLSFHGYFNLSDKVLSKTHGFSDYFPKRSCTDENDYYKKKELIVPSEDYLYTSAFASLQEAIKDKRTYFELCPAFDCDNDTLKPPLFEAIKLINDGADKPILSESFRVFNTSEYGNGLTIEIYYIDPEDINNPN